MTQHTPGPWSVVPDMRLSERHFDGSQDEYLSGYNINSPAGEIVSCEGILADGEANARLIAAAPEMLMALKVVAGLDIRPEALRFVDAAIDKAEGRDH